LKVFINYSQRAHHEALWRAQRAPVIMQLLRIFDIVFPLNFLGARATGEARVSFDGARARNVALAHITAARI